MFVRVYVCMCACLYVCMCVCDVLELLDLGLVGLPAHVPERDHHCHDEEPNVGLIKQRKK